MRAVRLAVVFLAFTAFATFGGAITSYNITVDGEHAVVNATFELYLEENPRGTNLSASWPLPAETELQSLQDSDGRITNYRRQDGQLRFYTLVEQGKTKEVVTVVYRDPDVVQDMFNGVRRVTLQLPGFDDDRPDVPEEVTQAVVRTEERLLSETHPFRFDYRLESHRVTYDGEGALNVQMAVGDGGTQYDHFTLFGEGNLTEADAMFDVVPAVLGFYPEANTYPVIMLPTEEYDRKVDQWSAGQYRSGGLIFIRRSAMEDDDIAGIMMHELVHAFNAHALRWSTAPAAWFDEGTAKYVEFLVNQQRGVRQAEIFGEAVEWTAPCADHPGRCRYTLPSRMEPDDLWDYYREEGAFMYDWEPSDPANRVFGYAFSELLIRNHIRNNGPTALRPVYAELRGLDAEREAAVTDPREHARIILDAMATDFSPCWFPSRDRLEQCLDAVNAMEPAVPEPPQVGNRSAEIVIRKIERPKAATTAETLEGLRQVTTDALSEEGAANLLEQIRTVLVDLLQRLMAAMDAYR